MFSGADFAHEGADEAAAYAFDVGEVHSVEAVAFFGVIDGDGVFVLLFAIGLFVGFFDRCLLFALRCVDVGDDFFDFLVKLVDVFAGGFPAVLVLLEYEEVFFTVVAVEGGEDVGFAALAASVAKVGEELGVALASENGFDDGLPACSIDVAKDVVDLEVHFDEDFLHASQDVCGILLEGVAVADEGAQGEDFLDGTKGVFEESGGVELLEPLGIADVGLFAGDAFDVAGVDEVAFDSGAFEDVVAVMPIVAGAFHGNGGDVVAA